MSASLPGSPRPKPQLPLRPRSAPASGASAHTLNLLVTAGGLEAACHALVDAAHARTINLQFRELTEDMGPALSRALEGLMRREPHLSIQLPDPAAPRALGTLIDHLAGLNPMRVSLGGLGLVGMQQPEDIDAETLYAIKRFVRVHGSATVSLVGLLHAMRIKFSPQQVEELVSWASQECPEAMEPLKELPI